MAAGRNQITASVHKSQPCQVAEFGANGAVPQTPATVAAATSAPAAITALAAPAGGTGAAAGGWDTAGNRDLAIASINALRTDITALRTTVASLVTLQNQLRAQLVACGLAV